MSQTDTENRSMGESERSHQRRPVGTVDDVTDEITMDMAGDQAEPDVGGRRITHAGRGGPIDSTKKDKRQENKKSSHKMGKGKNKVETKRSADGKLKSTAKGKSSGRKEHNREKEHRRMRKEHNGEKEHRRMRKEHNGEKEHRRMRKEHNGEKEHRRMSKERNGGKELTRRHRSDEDEREERAATGLFTGSPRKMLRNTAMWLVFGLWSIVALVGWRTQKDLKARAVLERIDLAQAHNKRIEERQRAGLVRGKMYSLPGKDVVDKESDVNSHGWVEIKAIPPVVGSIAESLCSPASPASARYIEYKVSWGDMISRYESLGIDARARWVLGNGIEGTDWGNRDSLWQLPSGVEPISKDPFSGTLPSTPFDISVFLKGGTKGAEYVAKRLIHGIMQGKNVIPNIDGLIIAIKNESEKIYSEIKISEKLAKEGNRHKEDVVRGPIESIDEKSLAALQDKLVDLSEPTLNTDHGAAGNLLSDDEWEKWVRKDMPLLTVDDADKASLFILLGGADCVLMKSLEAIVDASLGMHEIWGRYKMALRKYEALDRESEGVWTKKLGFSPPQTWGIGVEGSLLLPVGLDGSNARWLRKLAKDKSSLPPVRDFAIYSIALEVYPLALKAIADYRMRCSKLALASALYAKSLANVINTRWSQHTTVPTTIGLLQEAQIVPHLFMLPNKPNPDFITIQDRIQDGPFLPGARKDSRGIRLTPITQEKKGDHDNISNIHTS